MGTLQKKTLDQITRLHEPMSVSFLLDSPTLLPSVNQWAEEVLLRGGKKLRPRLCLWMAAAAGLAEQQAAPFARIAELVHAATLAHDDVIDSATERRNLPTLNVRLTQARAVLSGDLLLSRAMVELSELGQPELVKRMAEVLEDLVTGEWLQLEIRDQHEVPSSTIEHIGALKTASLMAWCCEMPWMLRGASDEVIRLSRIFGYSLGKAFQCRDDILDYRNGTGKVRLQDLSEGLLNSVSVRLLQDPDLKSQVTSLPEFHQNFQDWVSPALLESVIAQVAKIAKQELEFAKQALDQLQVHGSKKESFSPLYSAIERML